MIAHRLGTRVLVVVLAMWNPGCGEKLWPEQLPVQNPIWGCLVPSEGWDAFPDHPWWVGDPLYVTGVVEEVGSGLPPVDCWREPRALWGFAPLPDPEWALVADAGGQRWIMAYLFPGVGAAFDVGDHVQAMYEVRVSLSLSESRNGYLAIERELDGGLVWLAVGPEGLVLTVPEGVVVRNGPAVATYHNECGDWEAASLEVVIDGESHMLSPGDVVTYENHTAALPRSARIADLDAWDCHDTGPAFFAELGLSSPGD